jgi:hypothetical protein
MSILSLSIGAAQDAVAPPDLKTEVQPPVLITEQEVMLGTAAAVRRRPLPITGWMIGVLRTVAAWRPPPPRPHYAPRSAYIERAAMAREMDRL